MVFAQPYLLWLLPLALAPLALLPRQRMSLRRGAAAVVTTLRIAALAAVILALAQPILQRPTTTWTTVAVVDLSASVGPAQLAAAQTDVRRLLGPPGTPPPRLVVFAEHAAVADAEKFAHATDPRAEFTVLVQTGGAAPPASTGDPNGVRAAPGSAVADALQLAGALIPAAGRGELHLYTDGYATDGDAAAAARHLADRGLGVQVHPLETPRPGAVILRTALLPPTAGVGATVELTALVAADAPTDAQLVIRRAGGDTLASVSCHLQAGQQTIMCPLPLSEEGTLACDVQLVCDSDRAPEHTRLPAAVFVQPPQQVGVVTSADDPGTPAAIANLLGRAAHVQSLTAEALATPGALDRLDALVLADLPAEALDTTAQQQLRAAVTSGLGLIVTGGRRSFGAGGYADSPLADLLPVACSQSAELRDPSSTLVIIIDTSGSMGGGRVDLAKEVARLALARLKPHDKAGIVEFYGSKRWAAPIQSAGNAIDLQRALNRLSSGGGTVILPAIEEAYYALLNVRTRTRHVLVLTDGGVEPGAFEPLIRQMSDKGITVSTVLVGPGRYSAFLSSLAQWGRGRFYTAPDRFTMPEIIIKQPQNTLLPPFAERRATLNPQGNAPWLQGLDFTTAPALAGYNLTEPRPTADVLLTADQAQPILARWQYGLGAVAALTTHAAGEWSRDLAAWPPYATLWSNLARSAARARLTQTLRVLPRVRAAGVEVDITSTLPTSPEDTAPLALQVTAGGQTVRTITLDPIAPQHWNTLLTGLAPGTCTLQARTTGGTLGGMAAFALPAPREVPGLGVNQPVLDDITAQRQRAAQQAATATLSAHRAIELWPYLTLTALGCFLLHIVVRRLPVSQWYRVTLPRAAGLLLALALLPQLARAQVATTTPTSAPAELPAALVSNLDKLLQSPTGTDADAEFEAVCRAVLARDGHLDALVAHLRKAGLTDDDTIAAPLAAHWLARAAARNGDLQLARDVLEPLTKQPAVGTDVSAELGRVEEQLGHESAALKWLTRALQQAATPEARFALQVRRALLAYDIDDARAAGAALRAAAEIDLANAPGAARAYAAQLAALHTDFTLATELVGPTAPQSARPFHDHLFRGHWQLHAGHADAARAEFRAALAAAPLPRDRRYACERIIASARDDRSLPALADAWLAEPNATPEQARALVEVLRELGRPDDALAVLRRAAASSTAGPTEAETSLEQDAITLAIEAGRLDAAQAAYQALIERAPHVAEWPAGLARLYLLQDRPAEARAVLQTAIDRHTDAASLLALADAAGQLALDDVALTAAHRAADTGPGARVSALLFEAELARRRGQGDRALEIVAQAAEAAGTDDSQVLRVAETYERYGDKARALEYFRRLQEQSGSEDLLVRVAWLLEENERYDEARAMWRTLWNTTRNTARAAQAEERLLDLTSQKGNLAELAIELEERLEAGQATQRELQLLVNIYTTANDPVSAAEILHEYARQSGQQVPALVQLSRVYLACNQFGRCRSTLEQLVVADPNNAGDYLQQLAVMAIERKQPAEALAALDRLRAVTTSSALADEYSAGVLALAGLPREAAAAYGRLLTRYPDRIDALLLWGGALKTAGEGARAVARFQQLTEEADADDLFAVAVDGLLNLEPGPPALRAALRRVYARLAADPEKLFLYRLAGDLHEALNRTAAMRAVLEQAVLVAGEQRSPLLRELMDSARADGVDASVVELGRSLLALGEEVPPQVLLDLGETLLKNGDVGQAAHTFARAAASGDYAAIQQRIATVYEDAGRPADADRVVRLLLVAEPDDVQLLIRSARLCQQLDQPQRAAASYWRALELMLGRLPAAVDAAASAPDKEQPDRMRVAVRKQATNLDEIGQSFDVAVRGLLHACATDAQRDELLSLLPERATSELAALAAANGNGTATLSRFPRLERLATLVRHAAFALRRPDVADDLDRALVAKLPKDRKLRATVIQHRLDWGLEARAESFIDPDSATDLPVELVAARLIRDPHSLTGTAPPKLTAALVTRVLPLLIATNQLEAARQVLRRFTPESAGDAGQTVAPTMVAGALALQDADTLRLWTLAWLDACLRQGGGALSTNLAACVRATWNHLADTDRATVVARLARALETLTGEPRLRIEWLHYRLAQALPTPAGDLTRLATDAGSAATLSARDAAELLDAMPAGDRAAFLQAVAAARPAPGLRTFLLDLGNSLEQPLDDDLGTQIAQLFAAAPRPKVEAEQAYSQLARAGWNRNPAFLPAATRIIATLRKEAPDDLATLTATARVQQATGQREDTAALVRKGVDRVLAAKAPDFRLRSMLEDLAGTLTPAEFDDLLTTLRERAQTAAAPVVPLFALGALLEQAGRLDEAGDAYVTAFNQTTALRPVNQRLIDVLTRTGRNAELAHLLGTRLTVAGMEQTVEWRALALACCQVYDLPGAARAADRDSGPLAPVQAMQVARLAGDTAAARSVLLRFIAKNQAENKFFTPVWPRDPSPGGLVGWLADNAVARRDRPDVYAALADLPFAATEYAGLWRTLLPAQRDAAQLATARVRAARAAGQPDTIAAELRDGLQRDAVTTHDRLLAVTLINHDPNAFPADLAPLLDAALLFADPGEGDGFGNLARGNLALGRHAQAQAILRWCVAREAAGGYTTTRSDDRIQRVEDFAACAPGDALTPAAWRALAPTPLDNPSDLLEAAWLAQPDHSDTARLARIRALLQTPRGADFRQTLATLGRLDAAAGRSDDLASAARRLLEVSTKDRGSSADVIDVTKLLPTSAERATQQGAAQTVAATIDAQLTAGKLYPIVAVRTLCLLGNWCATHDLPEPARQLLDRARPLSPTPNESWLWLADLARACGDDSLAEQLERELLPRKLLPVLRLPALLDRIEQQEGQAAADALAAEARTYTSHPDIVRRAARHAGP